MQTTLSSLRFRGNKLELTLRDLGSFWVTDYLHTFPLRRTSPEEYNLAWLDSHRKVSLKPYQRREFRSFFDIIQIDAPPEIARSYYPTLEQLRQHLLHHPDNAEYGTWVERMFNYLQDNPISGKKPYSLERVLDHLLAHPRVQPRHHSIIRTIFTAAEDYFPVAAAKSKDKNPKMRIPSPLPEQFYHRDYASLARWRTAPQSSVVDVKDSLAEEIRQGKKEIALEGRLKYVRMRTASEILGEKVIFLDSEVPLFDTAEEEVSWVGLLAHQRGDTSQGYLHALYPAASTPLFSSSRYSTEGEIVAGVADQIKSFGATVFVAYNVPFDVKHLREVGEFTIGEDDEEPKIVSSLKFFERIGVKGMDVLDLFRWARTQFRYLPNQKLVTIAKRVLGEDAFSKQINYSQQAELERICRGQPLPQLSSEVAVLLQGRTAPEIIASYLREDVQVLERLWNSDFFQHGAEDLAFMSRLFQVDFFLLAHEPNRIKDYLDRKFFEKVGTFYSAIFPKFKIMTGYEKRVQDKLERTVKKCFPSEAEGRIEHLHQVFLPLGKALREDLAWFYPEVKEFQDYVDSHKNDPQRHFFLALYEDALTSRMWTGYAAYLYEKDKWKIQAEAGNHNQNNLESRFKGLYNVLKAHGFEERLNHGTLAQKDFQTVITSHDQDYFQKTGIDFRGYYALFKQWSRAREKNRILWGAYGDGWEQFDWRLGRFCTQVQDFLQRSGLEIAHAQGKYLYLRGDGEKLKSADCPVIPVDQIKVAYLADDTIFYQRFGYFKGFKRGEEPTHYYNLWEMETYGPFLEEILAGNQPAALASLWKGLRRLAQKQVTSEELVWKTASTRMYRAFEQGQVIPFYDWRREETCRVKVIKDVEYRMERQREGKRDFILEPCLEKKEIVYHKRYLLSPQGIKFELEMHCRRAEKGAIALIKPLLGQAAKEFAQEALASEPRKDLEYFLNPPPPRGQISLF